ncbi:MAG: hypothetical protein NTZ86_06280 [Legionellales bacterium]|nr:hypothetical protein [Legionellales bacterium]
MFRIQLKALKKSIADPERAIDAYTDIINEKLRSGNKTYTVAAIFNVFARRVKTSNPADLRYLDYFAVLATTVFLYYPYKFFRLKIVDI